MPNVTVAEAVEDYLVASQAKGHSMRTIDLHGRALRMELMPWCDGQGIALLEDLDQRAIDRLGALLLTRDNHHKPGTKLSRATVRSYLAPIQSMLSWAEREGYGVTGRPQLPSRKRKAVDVLSREQIQTMEDAARTERDKLIVRLLGDCGPRVSELCELRTEDLVEQSRQWFLRVRGKGGHDRWVPVPRLWPRLRRLAGRGRPQDSTDHLFLALRRSGGLYHGLDVPGVREVLRELGRQVGIKQRVHPHLLRHSAITWMLSKQMNAYQVKMVVGNFNELDGYVHLTTSDAHDAMAGLYE